MSKWKPVDTEEVAARLAGKLPREILLEKILDDLEATIREWVLRDAASLHVWLVEVLGYEEASREDLLIEIQNTDPEWIDEHLEKL